MKIYGEDNQIIFLSQFRDPLMDHLYEKIIFHLKKSPGKKILDIGCGVGKIILMAGQNGFDVTGIEVEKKVAKLAEYNLREFRIKGKIIKEDIENIKLKENYYDTVICSEVIEHVANPQKIIDIAYKSLKKNGLFIMTTPHSKKLWTVADDYAQHKRRFELEEVKKLLNNFRLINFYTIGFPFMLLLVIFYNLTVKFLKLTHSANWRKNKLVRFFYYSLATFFLKIDDRFNFLKLGTNIVVIATKNSSSPSY